jgi:hypothetical protein
MVRRPWVTLVEAVRRDLRRRQRQWARRVLRGGTRQQIVAEINPPQARPLESFRLFAVLGTWMEEDVVEATVRNALAQGVEAVYVVDNASTDRTVERAVAAGATLAESFDTDVYEERVRILLMNAVVARISLATGDPHIWWLWLDADEFPEGPDGLTIAEYLHTLDRRFRVVGSTYYNHFPTDRPQYIPGFHPIDFQPLCEAYRAPFDHGCGMPHYKHPLQRFDRAGPFLTAGDGFHTLTVRGGESLYEPLGGIVTHHVMYRGEAFTRARLELLCGGPARNAFNHSVGNRSIQQRFDSLDAVYAQNWPLVNNLRETEPELGVHPAPWPDPTSTRRWYDEEDLAMAKEKWRTDYSPSADG